MSGGKRVSQDKARQLDQAASQVAGLPPRRPEHSDARRAPAPSGPTATIKVTSTTPTGNLYPAVVTLYNAASDTWTDLTAPVWYKDPANIAPTSGTRYQCVCEGTKSGVPVYIPGIAGGATGGFARLVCRDKNNNVAVTNVSDMEADANGVMTWSSPAGSEAQLNFTAAANAQNGIVNQSAQQLGNGDKTIDGNATVTNPHAFICGSGSTIGPSNSGGTGVLINQGGAALDLFDPGLHGGVPFPSCCLSNFNAIGFFYIDVTYGAIDSAGNVRTGITGTSAAGDTIYGGLVVGAGAPIGGASPDSKDTQALNNV